MGEINHNCVIATTWQDELVDKFEHWVRQFDIEWQRQFAITGSRSNGYSTIVLTPDGSKEGWITSDQGDQLRADFIDFLESHAYDDGSSPFAWVEVGYGERGQKVLRGNNVNCYGEEDYAGRI